ncbi:MAG: glycyl-radical enzyme activating protein [Clostridia bacterium]|nr:glycyl-radical enzyme activating protein [Clostridia bacterium]
MESGMIFDINEFAVHDGPGIRLAVFLKGCPLRCQWCHNPEGMSFDQQLIVGNAGCLHCGRCTAVCVHRENCIACGECIGVCPANIRRFAGRRVGSDELIKELLVNRDFLLSHGGVTFSGGEPLTQAPFLFEVMRGIKPVNIAVETSGYAPADVFLKMLELCDVVLMDIKQADSEIHRRYTGVGNEIILRNLRLLILSGHRFIIRIPVIPGVNDNVQAMGMTASLLRQADSLERVELLKYNRMAGAKYPLIGKEYEFSCEAESPPLETFQKIFEQEGLRAFIA